MKKVKNILLTLTLILLFTALLAQAPPPPNGGSNPGSGNTPVGSSAPIGGGLFILLGLGAAYGGKKLFYLKKERHQTPRSRQFATGGSNTLSDRSSCRYDTFIIDRKRSKV